MLLILVYDEGVDHDLMVSNLLGSVCNPWLLIINPRKMNLWNREFIFFDVYIKLIFTKLLKEAHQMFQM